MLFECISSLVETNQKQIAEIIVINDGDKRVDFESTSIPVLIFKNKLSGVASARNLGAEKANSEIILFFDDDMIPTEGMVQRIINFHAQHQRSVLNLDWIYPLELTQEIKNNGFGRYLINYGFTSLKGLHNNPSDWNDIRYRKMNAVTSQNLSIRKSLFTELGGYDDRMPFAGFEDAVFSKNLVNAGVDIYLDTVALTYHNERDRIELKPWLDRKVRGSFTRRIAVQNGFGEFNINYGTFKGLLLNVLYILKTPIIAILDVLKKIKLFDRLTYSLVNVLLAVSIFEGYELNYSRYRKSTK